MDKKMSRYEKLEIIRKGEFATVYKARDILTQQIVAIKKIHMGNREEDDNDGINRMALREIKILQELRHGHVISLIDVCSQYSNVSLVYDYMDTDLDVIIKDPKIVFCQGDIKAYMMMTLRGLEYLHLNWIFHRDLKPNNLLINSEGILKIGDFGLAKMFGSPNRRYTSNVVTRWYRAPELLFGARQYGPGIDIWSVGCILAELLLRVPFLPGDSDLDQLTRIFKTLGTPSYDIWPTARSLRNYVELPQYPEVPLSEYFIAAPDDLLELANRLFKVNPLHRCTTTEALTMKYFLNNPPPTLSYKLPMPSAADDNETEPELEVAVESN